MGGGEGVPLKGGTNVKSLGKILAGAWRKARMDPFTWHDLRQTARNNWWLQGQDYFRIMAATGRKTMTGFKRFNIVSREELKALTPGHYNEPQHQNRRGAK
jgi:hypothetical protein